MELKKRYDFRDSTPFAIMSCLDASIATSSLATRPPSLVPLMMALPRIIDPADADLQQKIDDQWRKLPLLTTSAHLTQMEPDEFWAGLKDATDVDNRNEVSDLASFVLDVLSLPHSSAACERIFFENQQRKNKVQE